MADTAALVVALSAQLTQFEKDLLKANQIAESHVKKIETTFNNANIHVGGLEELGSKLTKLLTVGGILEAVNLLGELNEKIARIGESSERLGITTDKLQALHFAAVETGSSVEKMDAFLDRFARTTAEAGQGSGKLYEFLKANNIEAAKFAKLGLVDQLEQYSRLVANAKTPQAALNDVFLVGGRNASDLANAIKLIGEEGLDPLEVKARAAGVVIEETLIAQAKKAAAEWNILKLQIEVFFETMALSANNARKTTLENAEQTGRETTDFLKTKWKEYVDYLRANNPEILKNFKELWDGMTEIAGKAMQDLKFSDAQRTVNQRRGSEILAPGAAPGVGSFDPRLSAVGGVKGKPTEDFSKQADDLNKLLLNEQKRTEVLQAEAIMVGQTAGATAELKTQVRLENEALEKNIPLTDQVQEKIYQAAVAAGKAADAVYKANQAWQGMNTAVQFAGNQMIDVMVGLTNKTLTAQQAMKQLTDTLVKALLQAALLGQGPLASIMGFAPAAAGGTGGLAGIFTGLSGRQGGGSVTAGRGYIVGEHGTELFVPSSQGQIVPGSLQRGGAGGSEIIINNYTAADSETKQTKTEGPNGERIVIDIIKKAQSRGEFDSTNRSRFGLRPAKVR